MTRFTALLLVVVAAGVGAWDWPVADAQIEMTFGQTFDGGYSRGIRFAGPAEEVHAVEGGIVVMVRPDSGHPYSLGSVIVIQHENGIRTFYANLDSHLDVSGGERVAPGDTIGVMGTTGRTEGTSLYFLALDTRTGAWINPMLLLPTLADDRDPVIQSVWLEGKGSLFELRNRTSVPPGEYTLILASVDRLQSGALVSPYAVSTFVDGLQVFSVTYDRIEVRDGRAILLPGPDMPHSALRTVDGEWRIQGVTVPVGRTSVEIIVQDFAGRSDSISWQINGEP